MSVKELVEAAKKDQEALWIKQEEEKIKAKKEKELKDFETGVNRLMSSFESRIFDLDSSEEKVAKEVLEEKGTYLDINGEHVWKVFHEDSSKDYSLEKCKKYQDWIKALEEKFGVDIYIDTHYIHTSRYSNSGYIVGTDDHYQGVKAYISLKK